MVTFTKEDKQLLVEALNFLLKNQQNALMSASIIVPLAAKVEAIEAAEPTKPAPEEVTN